MKTKRDEKKREKTWEEEGEIKPDSEEKLTLRSTISFSPVTLQVSAVAPVLH